MGHRIVLATSDIFVRRLVPAMSEFVPGRLDFRIVDIHRSLRDLADRITELRPDALITESLPRLTEPLTQLRIPTVVADTDFSYPGVVSLDVDDDAVGREAAGFFRSRGYENFACVHNRMPYSDQRLNGFLSGLGDAGERTQLFAQPERRPRDYMESWNDSTKGLAAWLRELPRPVGVFAVHDPTAHMVLDAAQAEGLRVPEELAVVGANNDDLVCSLSYPPLSSVDIPWMKIGRLAVEWAERLIAGKSAPKKPILVRPGPVVVRQSTTLAAISDPDVRRMLQYFRDHLLSDINVRRACADLRLSRRTVEKKFALYLRTTPWERLNEMRVDAAKSLLVATSKPMSLVAEEAGFSNAERFSVIFRRHTGTSPRDFRRMADGTR